MKVLSVVVPCYNSEAYMKNCIHSLLTGGSDIEIIIVNTGLRHATGLFFKVVDSDDWVSISEPKKEGF